MKPLIYIIVGTIAIIWIELPPMLKRKSIREICVFAVLLLSGVSLCVATFLHMPLPSLLQILSYIYGPIYNGVMPLLK